MLEAAREWRNRWGPLFSGMQVEPQPQHQAPPIRIWVVMKGGALMHQCEIINDQHFAGNQLEREFKVISLSDCLNDSERF